MLVLSLGLFWGATQLDGAKGSFWSDLAPALQVLAWILPAYLVVSRRGRDPFVAHALRVPPRRILGAAAFSLLLLGLFVPGFAILHGWEREALLAANPALGDAPFPRPVDWERTLVGLAYGLVFVALPEEYFFRGVLQPALDGPHGPRWRLLGAPFGRGAVLAAGCFALCHLVSEPHPARLAVFFPALWFAWLRSLTGSLIPAIVAHALANAVQDACFQAWPS